MSILGGFYIYKVDSEGQSQITGTVIFKDIGINGEYYPIFGYFPIPTNVLGDTAKTTQTDLEAFNPIVEFVNTTKHDVQNADKGIYYYTEANLSEFLRKCYVPPIDSTV